MPGKEAEPEHVNRTFRQYKIQRHAGIIDFEHVYWGRIMTRGVKHKPTAETRAQVSALKSYGHTNIEIATFLSICDDTLTYYYFRELETAAINANAEVAGRLYNRATKKDDLSAQIFWLKTRARWRTEDGVPQGQDKSQLPAITLTVNDPIEAAKIYQQIMIGS